ncbi:histone-like nucleoid-structuring protein Lsr2 [Streptomyces virginiae]|uniref:histone-like nucleoid-structuring protein Lsr2 n=1 Tax=Streptomyces virginiae TaxID=1961 RepID=UPI00332AFE9A
MVQRTITIYTDDLSGVTDEDVATHTFSVDGVNYEVDLGPDNYQNLLDALGPFMGAGRKTGGTRRPAKRAKAGSDAGRIRAWAQSQGIEVGPRGRIPADIVEKYESAQ